MEPIIKTDIEARVKDTGDTMTGLLNAHGGISLNNSSKQQDIPYFLGIKAFADGGDVIWQNKENTLVGKAESLSPGAEIGIGNVKKLFTGKDNIEFSHLQMGVARCNFHGSDMNDVATYGNGIGMVNITTNTSNNIVNPVSNATGWHHYINLSWSDTLDYNNSTNNYWVTQIANACGSTDLYIRSRNGGSLDDSSAWVGPWTKILTEKNALSFLDNKYVNITGDTMTGVLTGKTGNKNGFKIGATNITCENAENGEVVLQGGFLRFGSETWDYSQWAGLKYDSSKKTIYLGVADGNIFAKNSGIITNGILELVNTHLLLQPTYRIYKPGSSKSWINGRDNALVALSTYSAYSAIASMKTTNGSWEMGVYTGDKMYFTYAQDVNYNSNTNTVTQIRLEPQGVLFGAAWNDYAEFREYTDFNEIPYGRVVIENGDDTLSLSTKRLQAGGNICSDTFGFAIGETEKNKMPIAVSGRALAYTNEPRETYKPGEALCTGPNGTVSKMTREEVKEFPDRIIGYVSAIPQYEIWGSGNVKVNGRIWVKVC